MISDNKKMNTAFTIVELLVVIVVIGILATITIISYSGVQNRANIVAIQAQLASDSNLIKMYNVDHGSYPTALDSNNCPTAPEIDTKYCLKNLSGATMSYSGSITTFNLAISKNGLSYKITDMGNIVAGIVCPAGFITVPGSATYGTSDFCVMKYEAKADDNGDGIGDTNQTTGYNTWPANTHPISASRKLVSTAVGYPVASISQPNAIAASSSAGTVYGCSSGCHLISEAEWMTIAQNVLSVASNWSGGSVGSGYIFSGHNDGLPSNALVADANDLNGYTGTGQISPSNQRRTLTLTNGEVIWDFAGNIYEWTSGQMTGNLPSGMGSWGWYNWTAVSGGIFAVNPYPSGTGISGSAGWNNTNGIGRIYGLSSESRLCEFIRSGFWADNSGDAGVLALSIGVSPVGIYVGSGFRVAK